MQIWVPGPLPGSVQVIWGRVAARGRGREGTCRAAPGTFHSAQATPGWPPSTPFSSHVVPAGLLTGKAGKRWKDACKGPGALCTRHWNSPTIWLMVSERGENASCYLNTGGTEEEEDAVTTGLSYSLLRPKHPGHRRTVQKHWTKSETGDRVLAPPLTVWLWQVSQHTRASVLLGNNKKKKRRCALTCKGHLRRFL